MPAADPNRLPTAELAAYSIGWMAHQIVMGSLGALYPIYNVELGLAPTVIGVSLGVGRVLDGFADVVVGHRSDRCRSRWGRRRPFVFAGALAIAVALPAMFTVPAGLAGQREWLTAFLNLTLLALFFSYSVYVVPLLAMGFELAGDTAGRTRIQAWRTVGMTVGGLLPAWAYRIALSEWFPNAIMGIRWVALGMGLVAAATGILPALLCREPPRPPAPSAAAPPPPSLWIGFRETLRNGQFVILLMFTTTFVFAINVVSALGTYVYIFLLYGGDKKLGSTLSSLAGTVMQGVGLAAIPVVVWLVARLGKRTAVGLCLGCVLVASLSKWPLMDPRWPYAHLFVTIPLLAFAGSGFWIVVSAMKADICDLDELQTGQKRAGLYAAVAAWFGKFGGVLAMLLSGWLVDLVGIDVSLATQSEPTLQRLRLFFFLPSAVLSALGLWCWRYYRLEEGKVRRIQSELAVRRAAAPH